MVVYFFSSVAPPIALQASADTATNPWPLQAFLPLQAFEAVLQADVPLQTFLPKQWMFLDAILSAAIAGTTAPDMMNAAAAAATAAPEVLVSFISESLSLVISIFFNVAVLTVGAKMIIVQVTTDHVYV